MKYLSILISAFLVVLISGDTSISDEISTTWVEAIMPYQSKCQEKLSSDLTLLDAFSGDLNKDKVCFMECMVMELMQDDEVNARMEMKMNEIEAKLKENCVNHGLCEDIENLNNAEKCMETKNSELGSCSLGEIILACTKEFYPGAIEVIKKHL